MKYNGAQITIKLLELHNIETIAGIPGGMNLPLYDALYESKINHILARHEQGAAFIAQGMARATGKVSVCFATSGPGATNLLTAIADAKLDSIPIIAITGQVNYPLIGTDAFQEVDVYGLTVPITKHNFLVRDINELFTVIPEAFKIASEGRPGPVVIDIPKDIQNQYIEVTSWPKIKSIEKVKSDIKSSTLCYMAELINNSRKPIIYGGGGIIAGDASDELQEFATKNSIPVALTLMGLGAFPSSHELSLGMLGMHGAPYTNYLMHEADLIIALGVRFDDRATGNIQNFCPKATIIHVDIDSSEINKIRETPLSLKANIKDFINSITPLIEINDRSPWRDRINAYKKQYPLPKYEDILHPSNIIKIIGECTSPNTIISTDVGQHQMWTAQIYPFESPRTLLTSSGLGTMGFGLPAAIGASLAYRDKNVICISGDGSILMNIQELATLADHNLNLKLIILNNHRLGLVRQQQELFYNEHYMASKFISNPDFKLIGEGFNIKSHTLSNRETFKTDFLSLINEKGPILINIFIEEDENVLPMVAPGGSNTVMIGGGRYNG